ncbi:MAG TPA: hypothetical protein VEY07_01780 [Thermoplasmata archaeon]|nr:hypothetical protein [Thermoplasmata archaeon]
MSGSSPPRFTLTPARARAIQRALPLLGGGAGFLAIAGVLLELEGSLGSVHLPLWQLFVGLAIITLIGAVAILVFPTPIASRVSPRTRAPPKAAGSAARPRVELPDPPRPAPPSLGPSSVPTDSYPGGVARMGTTDVPAPSAVAAAPPLIARSTGESPPPSLGSGADTKAVSSGSPAVPEVIECATCGRKLPAREAWRRCRSCGRALCVGCLTESVRTYGSGYCRTCSGAST